MSLDRPPSLLASKATANRVTAKAIAVVEIVFPKSRSTGGFDPVSEVEFSGKAAIVSHLHVQRRQPNSRRETIMKFTTIALAAALALSGTAAFAKTVHHQLVTGVQRDVARTVHLRPNYGNPNGNPDGPTTLSGTGDSTFGGSSAGTSGYN